MSRVSLDALYRQAGKLPAVAVARFLRDGLSDLAELHARGVPHGELTAASFDLSPSGSLRLGEVPFTAAPGTRGFAKDLFSLGCVFARLGAGFDEADASRERLRNSPGLFELEPGLPMRLEQILERLLGRDHAGAFESAVDALKALEPLVERGSNERCAELLVDAIGTSARAARALALGYVERARALRGGAPLAAGLYAYRALALCRDDAEIAAAFHELATDHLLDFGDPRTPERDAIEADLADGRDDGAAWLRLGRYYAAHGNPYRAVVCWKRYLRYRADDLEVVAEVLALTTPEEPPSTPARKVDPVPTPIQATAEETGVDTRSVADTLPPYFEPYFEPPAPETATSRYRGIADEGEAVATTAALARPPRSEIEIEPPAAPGEYWRGPGKRFAAAFALLMTFGITWHWYNRPSARESGPAAMAARLVLKKAALDDAMKRLGTGDESALGELKLMLRGGMPPPRPLDHRDDDGPGAASGGTATEGPRSDPFPWNRASPSERSTAPEPYFETRLARIALHEAEQHYLARRYDDAVLGLDHLIHKYPQSLWFGFEPMLLRAHANAARGYRQEAARDYRAVIAASNPENEIHRRAQSGLRTLLRAGPALDGGG